MRDVNLDGIFDRIQDGLVDREDKIQFLEEIILGIRRIQEELLSKVEVSEDIPMKGVNLVALAKKADIKIIHHIEKDGLFKDGLFPKEYNFLWDSIKDRIKEVCKDKVEIQVELKQFIENSKNMRIQEAINGLKTSELKEVFKEYLSLRDSIISGEVYK